ncbi:rhomboid family intramembrane serine protease [Candidatus Micrarchaeota archaeon]|nr:rhomboid family intramembrane serine protease [Candidatus Micrarchaeota archaeon]
MSLDLKRYISATNILIVIIILTFIIQTWDDGYREAFRFSITEVINQPYRIFTHVFLHGHPIHLFQNMYALFIFGNLLESKFNSKELLKLFFLGGFVGAISMTIVLVLGLGGSGTAIGASDSVSAVFGACVLLFLNTNIEVFFIKMKVRTALILFLIYEALDIFNIFKPFPGVNIAHAAHIGPFIFGYLYARFFLRASIK